MIEFGNRLVTGVVMLFTAAAVLGARWRRPYRRDLYLWSWGLPVWVMGNAIVGALVVWLHLSPVSVIAHFLLSLGALWNALVLYAKAGEDGAGPRRTLATPAVVRGCNALLVAAGLALVTGTIVTGSGPHAGDSDEAADRLPFDVGEVARVHGIAVVLFLGLTLLVLWQAGQGDAAPSMQWRLRALVTVIVAQGAVGYVQYFNDVPALLVGIHVLGAAVVWLAVLWVRLGVTELVEEAEAAEGVAGDQAAREWARAAPELEHHRS